MEKKDKLYWTRDEQFINDMLKPLEHMFTTAVEAAANRVLDNYLKTKGDSINFQPDTISGQFTRLNHAYKVNGKDKRPWKYELDGDSADAKETIMTSWFDTPVMPAAAAG